MDIICEMKCDTLRKHVPPYSLADAMSFLALNFSPTRGVWCRINATVKTDPFFFFYMLFTLCVRLNRIKPDKITVLKIHPYAVKCGVQAPDNTRIKKNMSDDDKNIYVNMTREQK